MAVRYRHSQKREKLQISVDRLLELGRTKGALSWGLPPTIKSPKCPLPGSVDAFSDRTCNSPDTSYTFQSGLAIACLAEAAKVLDQPKLADVAVKSLGYWVDRQQATPDCAECLSFPYSDSPNDAGRRVRNVNLFMGLGAAALVKWHDHVPAVAVLQKIMAGEVRELGQQNYGYLGVDDPDWKSRPSERSKIENHYVSIMLAASYISSLPEFGSFRTMPAKYFDIWSTCDDSRCRERSCKYWAGAEKDCHNQYSFIYCQASSSNAQAARLCEKLIADDRLVNPFVLVQLLLRLNP
jgi:hypothetical protein